MYFFPQLSFACNSDSNDIHSKEQKRYKIVSLYNNNCQNAYFTKIRTSDNKKCGTKFV